MTVGGPGEAFLAPPRDRGAANGSRLAQLIRWLV